MTTNNWWDQDTYWNVADNATYYRRNPQFPPVAPVTARVEFDGLTYVMLTFRVDQLRAAQLDRYDANGHVTVVFYSRREAADWVARLALSGTRVQRER